MYPLIAIPAAIVGYLVGRKAAEKQVSTKTSSGSSLDDISLGAWERFISAMEQAPRGNVDRKGKLGAFGMDPRRLADVGVMKKAWKKPDGSWTGEWAGKLSTESFLGNMPVQYAAFVRSMKAAAPKVAPLVGCDVSGAPATLSGLLGVSHVAGERGVESFVRDPAIRARFPGTAELFKKTNRIF